MLPFKKNIVYIEIHNGDLFGEIDLIASAKQADISMNQIFDTGELAE